MKMQGVGIFVAVFLVFLVVGEVVDVLDVFLAAFFLAEIGGACVLDADAVDAACLDVVMVASLK
jgi:hypothetical protein